MRERIRGELLEQGDDQYEDARRVWNGMVDKRPSLIARCRDSEDVVAALAIARDENLEVSVRGGGHSIAGHSVTEGGLMIDLSQMNGVRIDAERHRAFVGGGSLWADIDRESQKVGLGVTGGIVSHTGVGGLTLGGGYGWLARRHGLSCDNVVSAEVVTAGGETLTASSDENEDLLWGLRGGGGNFGVVTSFEFQLHEFDGRCFSIDLSYAADDGPQVLRGFRDFTSAASEDLTTMAGIGAARSSPSLPEEWHGQPVVEVSLVYLGTEEEGARIAKPLREMARPVSEMVQARDYLALQAEIDAMQEEGRRRYWKSHLVGDLTDDALDTFLSEGVEAAKASPLVGGEFISLGGAINRVGENDTAFGHRDSAFDFLAVAGWDDPAEDELQMSIARRFGNAMGPFGAGVYVNGLTDEGQDRVRSAYGPEKYERLVALKDKYDPENVFHLNQNVTPSKVTA